MDCKRAKPILSEYSLGFLSDDESREVSAHLAQCPGCSERLRKVEAAADLFSRVPKAAPPAGMWAKVEQRLIEEAAQAAASKPSLWSRVPAFPRRALALAGSLAVAVIMFAVFFPFWPVPNVVIPVSDTGAVTYVQGHVSLAIGNPLADTSGLILVAGIASREDAALCEGRAPATTQ